jgi:small subunit ribosomal protein S9
MAAKPKKDYTFAVGRRKTSIARVRLYAGRGENIINGKPALEYFPSASQAKLLQMPFEVTETIGKYYSSIKIVGGGKVSQLTAATHGLARALNEIDVENFRGALKSHGLLTRDARERQRRKVGTGGKSRRQKSSPKR